MRWGKMLFICAVAMTLFLVGRGQLMSTMAELTAKETALRVTLSELKDDALDIQNQISQVGSKSYVESVAREEYAFIKPGELRFEFTNPQALEPTDEEEALLRQALGE